MVDSNRVGKLAQLTLGGGGGGGGGKLSHSVA